MMKSCAGRPGGGRAGGVRTTLSPGGGLGNSPRALVRADELLTKATGEESEQTVLSIHGTMALRKTEKSSTKQNRPVAQHKTHRQKQQVGFKIAPAVGHGPKWFFTRDNLRQCVKNTWPLEEHETFEI